MPTFTEDIHEDSRNLFYKASSGNSNFKEMIKKSLIIAYMYFI
jgi:hypothetical protein